MKSINFDWKTSAQFISEEEIENIAQITLASNLENGTGAGKEFLGWLSLPTEYDKEEFIRIQQAAENKTTIGGFDCHRNQRVQMTR